MTKNLQIDLALNGLGWHPAAWQLAGEDVHRITDPGYWVELARTAEAAHLDTIVIEDSFGSPETGPVDRLDPTLVAAFVAPQTSRIGIVPSVVTTLTEPFNVAKAIQTVDHVSLGRAGVRVRVATRAADVALVGRRELPDVLRLDKAERTKVAERLFDEAADHVEVLRRLWDSWEDGAEIRDAATGRFIDRDKLHYVDFEGEWFSVKGPSIVPRSPQGQPPVTVLAHGEPVYRFAARAADVIYITPQDAEDAALIVAQVRAAEKAVDRAGPPLRILADLAVALDDSATTAVHRVTELDELAGAPFVSDSHVFLGTGAALAELVQEWARAGLAGIRLRPLSNSHDLGPLVDEFIPALQRRKLFRTSYQDKTLRARYGLPRPDSRYATTPTKEIA